MRFEGCDHMVSNLHFEGDNQKLEGDNQPTQIFGLEHGYLWPSSGGYPCRSEISRPVTYGDDVLFLGLHASIASTVNS